MVYKLRNEKIFFFFLIGLFIVVIDQLYRFKKKYMINVLTVMSSYQNPWKVSLSSGQTARDKAREALLLEI